jgi:hypothetical protein
METQIILAVLSAAAAIAGVATSLLTIKYKSDAEDLLVKRLMERVRAQTLKELRDEAMSDGVATERELQRIIESIEAVTTDLSLVHRRAIAQGLRQRSIKGRARYVAKVMNKAGIGSGSLPVAAE